MTVNPTTVSVADGRWNIPVYRDGKGETLLWLHGAGGVPAWTPDYQQLAESYDLVVPVIPGWNDTVGLEHIDDIHDMVFFLQDLADALGLEKFFLGGHSLGGMFAAELAAARPDMVKKLVLSSPAGLWMDETPVTDFFTLMPNELPGVLFGDPTNPAIAQIFTPPANEDELAERMYLQLANFSAAGKFLWPIPDKGLKKRLHRIKAPTLILWGDADRLIPPAYGPLFQSKIAKSQLATISGAGHMAPLEKSAEWAGEVKAFLG